jgi:uncharacterized iron-regulated membrane protein
MRVIDLLHRWAGGLLGLILAVLGLSGALLVHRDAWIALPHSDDAQIQDTTTLAVVTDKIMAGSARPDSMIFATKDFGLHRLTYQRGGAGAYVDQSGVTVAQWNSQWERPELWLFDLHHHLFAGDTGETVAGVAAIAGIFFVLSGALLWWRTRRTFAFRVWPARMTRSAILRQHRDLGVVLAPVLLLSLATGASMVFRPFTALILGPGAPFKVDQALAPPPPRNASLAPDLDWGAMIETARTRFPDAEVRILSLPRKDDGVITLRMRQPTEWLPNGRTTLWFAADTGQLVAARDATTLPPQVRGFNMLYPLHAAKVGGLGYRLLMTASGLALGVLGTLAVWSFWFKRRRSRRYADQPQSDRISRASRGLVARN